MFSLLQVPGPDFLGVFFSAYLELFCRQAAAEFSSIHVVQTSGIASGSSGSGRVKDPSVSSGTVILSKARNAHIFPDTPCHYGIGVCLITIACNSRVSPANHDF